MTRLVPGLIALTVVASIFAACEPQPPAAEPTARAYAAAWVKGDYQAERHGEHYVASAWSKKQDGRYHFDEGRWEHDK